MYKCIISQLLILAMAAAPLHAVADNQCCAPPPCEEECCPTGGSNWKSWVGGAVLLGAAAGAIAGAAASKGKHGSRGRNGERGPAGPAGSEGPEGPQGPAGSSGSSGSGSFTPDTGESLTFALESFSVEGETGLTQMLGAFFVSYPDGTVVQTSVQAIQTGLNSFPNIVVNNPVFGEYTAGLQVSGNPMLLAEPLPLTYTVTASRDSSITNLQGFTPEITTNTGDPFQSQTAEEFSYYVDTALPP